MVCNSLINVIFLYWTAILEITKFAINYIVTAQLDSIDVIASTPLGGTGVFDKITYGLTIFAAIACFWKLVMHFRDTERFDNVKSFTGFFSYFGVFILFIFSSHIVNYVTSLNTNINTSNIRNISSNIDKEINAMVLKDHKALVKEIKDLRQDTNLIKELLVNPTIIYFKETSFCISNMMKYLYYSFFGLLMTSVLAIPTVIMTLMVKIILSIMILGAKLVFLLAFIPGFENTWKTYMLNLLNVLLWVPIFNVIISFIIALMSAFMFEKPCGTGQIIWLAVVALILAFQAISLTTTAANTIISGAGVGIGGALGSMNAMSGAAILGAATTTTAIALKTVASAKTGKFEK